MKTAIIIILNKLLYRIGKLLGKGSSMPGQIALKLDKNILSKLQLPENVIVVTGSNGKTSTVEMISNTLKNLGYTVACNREGSNQTEGVTTMLLNASNLKGEVKKDFVVIESDERYTRRTLKYFTPKYLVVTNLYRDQMTRNGHPEVIYDIVKEAIDKKIHLILNTDDPLSSLYGYKRENVTYFGMNKNQLSKEQNDSVYDDGKYCPNCKKPLVYDYYHYAHIGSYHCQNCGHERKTPDYAITKINLSDGDFEINNKYKIKMNLKSMYNAYNLLATFSVLSLVKVDGSEIVRYLNEYSIQNDRVQVFDLNSHGAMLLTSKHENSISYNQSLNYVVNENKECTVVILVDSISRKYFTSETSWLWDINFDVLENECVKKIVLAGQYVNDLYTRFEYSTVNKNKIVAIKNLDEMMKEVKEKSIGKIYLITCFSDRMKFLDRR